MLTSLTLTQLTHPLQVQRVTGASVVIPGCNMVTITENTGPRALTHPAVMADACDIILLVTDMGASV